jgi:endonuclease YncB( thermonuclease family)
LVGIDAPEMSQVHGHAARSHLRSLLENRDVRVIVEGEDKYNRTLATLWTGKGNVCRAMVADGYAVASTYETQYANDMRTAKNKRLGLWSKGGIASPSEHRQRHARKVS